MTLDHYIVFYVLVNDEAVQLKVDVSHFESIIENKASTAEVETFSFSIIYSKS